MNSVAVLLTPLRPRSGTCACVCLFQVGLAAWKAVLATVVYNDPNSNDITDKVRFPRCLRRRCFWSRVFVRRSLTRPSLRPHHLCVRIGCDRVDGRDRAAPERPGQGPVLRHEQPHHRLRRLHGALQEVVAEGCSHRSLPFTSPRRRTC